MENLSTWMVGLDFTEMDQTLISYVKQLAQTLKAEKIHFVHVHPFWPDVIHIHLPKEIREPDTQLIKDKMEAAVYQEFQPSDQVTCQIFEGRPSFDLWRETYLLDVDLFIAGSKPKHKGRGILPRKFVRKSFCSVLFIPEGRAFKINKIWLPTDFSEYGSWALEEALLIAGSASNTTLVCQHVYQYPHAYYYQDYPHLDVQALIKEHAESAYKKFSAQVKKDGVKMEPVFNLREYTTVAQHIQEEAEAQEADLIILASGGKSRFSQMLIGSTTEKLVQLEHQIPLLILKHKKKQVYFWDILTGT